MSDFIVSWDTVQSVTLGVLGAGWIALAGFLGGLNSRVKRLETQHVTREEVAALIRSVATVKRIVYLLADKAGIANGALHDDDT